MKKPALFYLAIFAISCSVLIFETVLLRFFALKLLGSWGFLVISMAFLGIGAAGTYVYLRKNKTWKEPGVDFPFLSRFATVYTFSLPLSAIIFALLPLSPPQPGLTGPAVFEPIFASLVYIILFSIPFFLSGVCISYALSLKEFPTGKVLFFDLAGAGLGAVLTVLLLKILGGYGIIALSMGFAYLASAIFLREIYGNLFKKLIVLIPHFLISLLFLLGLLIYPSTMIKISKFDIVAPKTLSGEFKIFQEDFNGLQATYWNPVARVDLSKEGQSNSGALLSGLSKKYRDKKYTGRYILVDAGAPTRQFNLGEEKKDNEFLGHFLFSVPYQLKDNIDNVLIIGAGGGAEILIAKHFETKNVDVVEINSATIDILKGKNKKDSLSGAYSIFTASDKETKVNFYNEEGRSYLSRSNTPKYDILQLTGVDLLSALKSGGLVLSDNYLYTKEALGYYYDALKEGGFAQITYWTGPHALRLFITALAMLEAKSQDQPRNSLVAITDKQNWTNLIIKKGLFSDNEIEKIRKIAEDDDFEVLFDSQVSDELWQQIIEVQTGLIKKTTIDYSVDQKGAYFLASVKEDELPEGATKFKSLPFNLTPTYDDKPFFYSIYKNKAANPEYNPAKIYSEASQQKTSWWLVIIGSILAFVLILLPVSIKKFVSDDLRKIPIPPELIVFFGVVGVAFSLLEVVLIQKFSIFVGGPFYSMAVTLPTILIFYSLGAFCTLKIKLSRLRLLTVSIGGIAAFGALGYFFFDDIIKSLFYLGRSGRIIAAVLMVSPAGFFLGFPTPLILQALKEKASEALVPIMWGVNSSGNVIGALLFAVIAQKTGFNLLLLISGLLYPVALLILLPKKTIMSKK